MYCSMLLGVMRVESYTIRMSQKSFHIKDAQSHKHKILRFLH